MIAIWEHYGKQNDGHFAEPPWDEETVQWQAIDRELPGDHLARRIDELGEELDLAGLLATYAGRGSQAIPPEPLLKFVLYEVQREQLSSKRKKPEKVVVSVSESQAVPGRDKLKTFRPLYNVQLMHDIDSAFITAYGPFAQQNDPGTMGPMHERSVDWAGKKPAIILADSSYAGGPDFAVCERAGVEIYAPVSENDFSEAKRNKGNRSQLSKKDFTWLPEEQTYRCPEGHLFVKGASHRLDRSNDRTVLQTQYPCPVEHCRACSRRAACTPSSRVGRSVSRLEHEDLVEKLCARMKTTEAKDLYKLRRQTIELRYADVKEHRKLRCSHHYGPAHDLGEVGSVVLAHNLLILWKSLKAPALPQKCLQIPEKVPP